MNTLLFDLDGTLANSIPLHYKSYLMFLHRYGHEGSREEFDKVINGPSMSEILSLLKSRYNLPESQEALGEHHLKLLVQAYSTKIPLFEGSVEFLELAQRAGLRMAIVTSAPPPLADAFLQRHQIADFFTLLVTPEGLTKSKPDPAIYRRALEQLAIQPSEGLVFEDSVNGVRAAVGARIPTVRIMHGGGEGGEEGAVAIATNWGEAWEVVQRRIG